MKMIFVIMFIVCMNDMIHLNEGFNYYDAQPGIPEDLVEDSKSGTEIKVGYRNLISNGRLIRNCIIAGDSRNLQAPNRIWFGPFDPTGHILHKRY